jgi:hypothetical protein
MLEQMQVLESYGGSKAAMRAGGDIGDPFVVVCDPWQQ